MVVLDEGAMFASRGYTMEIDGVPALLGNEVPTDAGARTVMIPLIATGAPLLSAGVLVAGIF